MGSKTFQKLSKELEVQNFVYVSLKSSELNNIFRQGAKKSDVLKSNGNVLCGPPQMVSTLETMNNTCFTRR